MFLKKKKKKSRFLQKNIWTRTTRVLSDDSESHDKEAIRDIVLKKTLHDSSSLESFCFFASKRLSDYKPTPSSNPAF